MATTITLDSISPVTVDANGHVRFRSSGGREREFASKADAIAFAQSMLTIDVLEALVVAKVLTVQPTLNNPSAFAGRSLTFDMSQPVNLLVIS